MVGLTATLVNREHADRLALDAVPAVATYMPTVESAHDDVVAALHDPAEERLAAVSKEQGSIDERHDTLARGVRFTLRGAIYWARDEAHADALRAVEGVLFPDGLRVVGYSYREEAGHATSVATNLTAAQKALLAEIPAGDKTLLARVEEWMDAARQLGALEDERADIGVLLAVPRRTIAARRRWARVIATLRGIVESTAIEAPETALAIAAIMSRIEAAERRAERGSRDADEEVEGDGAGGDGAGDDDADDAPAPGPDPGDKDPDGLDPVAASVTADAAAPGEPAPTAASTGAGPGPDTTSA